ncbi:MAG: MT-A70 family methyltransferase [Hyphomicrobium sp.]|jgi:N6-adenosine-specific RNA methylase IME4
MIVHGRSCTFPEFHPLADLFPLIEGAEFDALVADIEANGLHDPIVMLDGRILDGRNRFRAARLTRRYGEAFGADNVDGKPGGVGVLGTWQNSAHFLAFGAGDFDPTTVEKGPLAWVLSKNLHRRHLTDSQRTAVAADLVVLRQGRRTDLSPNGEKSGEGLSKAEAADALHVSERQIERQLAVKQGGAPGLVEAVKRGDVSVSAAAEIAQLPISAQLEVIRGADPKAFARVAKERRDERQAEKRVRRTEREAELGARQQALPDKRYGVILEDPEWQFEPFSRDTGMDRAADNHYPTSSLDALKAREVGGIAAADCALLMWATVPMLPQALELLAARGFAYKTHWAWMKDQIGTGYWNRNQHELLLLGTRGNLPAPAMGTQFRSVLAYPVGQHSAKPPFAHEIAEAYFPSLPKIELNARTRRDGWDAWGFEAPGDISGGDVLAGNGSSLNDIPADAPEKHAPGEPAIAVDVPPHGADRVPLPSGEQAEPKARAASPVSRLEAEPILRAHYATSSADALSVLLGGVPVPTIRTWAHRLGLTSKERIRVRGRQMMVEINGKREAD